MAALVAIGEYEGGRFDWNNLRWHEPSSGSSSHEHWQR